MEDDFTPIASTFGAGAASSVAPSTINNFSQEKTSDFSKDEDKFSPASTTFEKKPPPPPIKNLPFISPYDPLGMSAAGAGVGAVAGGAEMLSSGKRWALPVVGRSYSDVAESSTEMGRAYQRAKHKGPAFEKWNKLFTPAAPGEPADAFKRMLARSALPQRIFNASSRMPFGSTMAGGFGGLQLAGAAQAAKEGDIPTAAIQGAGGLGSLASLIPRLAPRLIGGAAGLASIPAQFVYEAIKGIPKERMENVAARKKFESLESPTPEEIAFYERLEPATSRQEFGYRP